MNKSLALKNKLYLFLLYIISLFIFIYLIFFLFYGERGVISYLNLKNLNNDYKDNLSILVSKNNLLSQRIKRLEPNSLDLDYLDEKIREKTGYLSENELLITFDN
tara:strand:- start:496 stop:810 length:315 start_codon:yes stop_codon:yes gene_type:complete